MASKILAFILIIFVAESLASHENSPSENHDHQSDHGHDGHPGENTGEGEGTGAAEKYCINIPENVKGIFDKIKRCFVTDGVTKDGPSFDIGKCVSLLRHEKSQNGHKGAPNHHHHHHHHHDQHHGNSNSENSGIGTEKFCIDIPEQFKEIFEKIKSCFDEVHPLTKDESTNKIRECVISKLRDDFLPKDLFLSLPKPSLIDVIINERLPSAQNLFFRHY